MMSEQNTAFESGEKTWIRHLGGLRNIVRQELIRRQLARHVASGSRVLDVGCGQGTQALWLAERRCQVTGVEPSPVLRDLCLAEARARNLEVEILDGSVEHIDKLLAGRRFDAVCAHGLLMYLDDRDSAIKLLAGRVDPGGVLSLVVRNRDSLAMRPALRRDWAAAIEAFDGEYYVNGLGLEVRSDRLDDVAGVMTDAGLEIIAWYGVRVFNDGVSQDTAPESDEDLDALLAAEDAAGSRDPYRSVAPLIHIVARR